MQKEGTNDGDDKSIKLSTNGNFIELEYNYTGGTHPMNCHYAEGFSDGHWHMLTVTKRKQVGTPDQGIFNVYVDGNLCITEYAVTQNVGGVSNLNKLYIGKDVAGDQHQFVGMLDNITFWNTDISDTEISELYHGGTPTQPFNKLFPL